MGKHNQSAALGTLSDFASSPATPDERLDRIETRLENIEKLLNTVLYAVTDLNESFDKVSKSPVSATPKGRGEGKKKVVSQHATFSESTVKSPQIKESILSYLNTETTPMGVRVISQAIGAKFQETKIALKQLLKNQKVVYIENKGYTACKKRK